MKYSELDDKDRWAAIIAGVRAGYNSIDDIEKAYNEYAEGGYLKQDDYYNNVLLQKDSNQKQYIKEQLEKRKTYADGGNIYGYSENDDALTFYKDIDDIYVTPNGNYYQGKEFNKRKQQDIITDINNNPALLFRPEYSKWYNYYRTEAKKQGWDFDETMSTMFNHLPFESQEWIVQNNPGAFRLLPQNVQSDYITRTKGMRPGALQRLVDDAGENFLGKSVNNAVTAASLISLPTALKSGRLIKSGIDKVADVGYKALNSTNIGRNATNLMTKAVLPAVETKWGIEGAINLPNDLRNVGQAINEGDYINAALEGVNTTFDASIIPVGMKNIPNLARGIKNEVGNVVQSVKNKTKPIQITKENTSKITDAQWDAAYKKAINDNNIEEAQRLRDLHFQVKAGNNAIMENDNLVKLYHSFPEKTKKFTSFSTNPEGRKTMIYTHSNPLASKTYITNKIKDKKQLEDFFKKVDNNEFTHELYGKLDNPVVINGNGANWDKILVNSKDGNKIELSTRKIEEQLMPVKNIDGFIVKDIRDIGGGTRDLKLLQHLGFDGNTPMSNILTSDKWLSDVRAFKNPSNLKSSNVITYDDLGNIIPLSKRDNFNINDIRYSLLPAGVGLSGYSLINNAD